MQNINYHCCVIVVDQNGILIEGPSGSGKTSLAMGLIDNFKQNNIEAALVSDDQAFLSVEKSALIATAPKAIAGKVEIRGFGICNVDHLNNTEIALIVGLEEDELIERMPKKETKKLLGVSLPFLKLPKRHEAQAIRIVRAWLKK